MNLVPRSLSRDAEKMWRHRNRKRRGISCTPPLDLPAAFYEALVDLGALALEDLPGSETFDRARLKQRLSEYLQRSIYRDMAARE